MRTSEVSPPHTLADVVRVVSLQAFERRLSAPVSVCPANPANQVVWDHQRVPHVLVIIESALLAAISFNVVTPRGFRVAVIVRAIVSGSIRGRPRWQLHAVSVRHVLHHRRTIAMRDLRCWNDQRQRQHVVLAVCVGSAPSFVRFV
jgi:hypothetical protein